MANAIALGSLTSQGIKPESEGYAQAFNTAKAQAQDTNYRINKKYYNWNIGWC